MKHLDLTLPSPAENLACDEALLDWCEENGGEGILRFWESPETFAVVGYANKVATEVNVAACKAHGIPILRRCSGGGAVLQGAGCLNYALVLQISKNPALTSISSANQFIMERNRVAIEEVGRVTPCAPGGGQRTAHPTVQGYTDLALDGLKFSGNSQRRKKNFLLFHGTFLLNFDLALVGEFLQMPSKQPDYRGDRTHDEFMTNLNLPGGKVKAALIKSWNAIEELKDFPKSEIHKLAAQKYSTDEWNFKL